MNLGQKGMDAKIFLISLIKIISVDRILINFI